MWKVDGVFGWEFYTEEMDAPALGDRLLEVTRKLRGVPSAVRNFMTSSGCSMEGALPNKETVPTVLGGSAILKLIWEGNLLYFPGFGDLQPYETWKFRICSDRAHAKGVVLCERACFCLLSAFYKNPPSKNPSKNLVFTENPYRCLLRTLLRSTCW